MAHSDDRCKIANGLLFLLISSLSLIPLHTTTVLDLAISPILSSPLKILPAKSHLASPEPPSGDVSV